jgi:hypothetical protein
MATTTTNFGWDIPQSTDLVKDGATAIAALGQDIDTALVDLKGGTTGQVLAKASGTDLDFSWVAVDPLTILDAKGDLISATAADTPARVAVGTNGQVLMADSTQSTGLRWATPAGGGKVLQVVTATTTTVTSTTATTPQATSVTATITPTSATSKILIIVSNGFVQTNNQFNNAKCKVFRGSVAGTQVDMITETQINTATALVVAASMTGIDSPATTSATTYVQSIESATGGQQVSVGARQNIILMEIGA